jgi:hypothetical protein
MAIVADVLSLRALSLRRPRVVYSARCTPLPRCFHTVLFSRMVFCKYACMAQAPSIWCYPARSPLLLLPLHLRLSLLQLASVQLQFSICLIPIFFVQPDYSPRRAHVRAHAVCVCITARARAAHAADAEPKSTKGVSGLR